MDPYLEACSRLEQAGIRYMIVGVFGINFYAQQMGHIITTADCDILIPAEIFFFQKALDALTSLGFVLEAGGEPLLDLDQALAEHILRARAVVVAERVDARIDLCTQIAGTDFRKLWRRHRQFLVEGIEIRVGPVRGLVESKRSADRPKDRLFFEQHKEIIEKVLRTRKPRR